MKRFLAWCLFAPLLVLAAPVATLSSGDAVIVLTDDGSEYCFEKAKAAIAVLYNEKTIPGCWVSVKDEGEEIILMVFANGEQIAIKGNKFTWEVSLDSGTKF